LSPSRKFNDFDIAIPQANSINALSARLRSKLESWVAIFTQFASLLMR
jgi:hypothetical protein